MNTTIDFKTAKAIENMSRKIDGMERAVSGFFNKMSDIAERKYGDPQVYLAAVGPARDLSAILLEEASGILPCFDETDDTFGISKELPVAGCYNPKQVLELSGKRYLTGPVVFVRFNMEGEYRIKQFQQSGQDCYLLMQLKRDADPALRFASMRYLEKQNIAPSIENYEILYRGNLPIGKRSVPQPELLEQLYQKFNCAQPMDYHGHSLSVSDVILLNQAEKISAHYVDSIGFRELSGFQDKQERSSVLSQLKAKCDMPECNPTKCRKGRNDHAI